MAGYVATELPSHREGVASEISTRSTCSRDSWRLGQRGHAVTNVLTVVEPDAARGHRESRTYFRDRRPRLYGPLLGLDAEKGSL